MYVLIKGRKFKVYEEKGKFYVQKRKTYKKYIKAKDVVMSPYPSQKRKQIPADISRILEEDKVLRSRMKSLDAILAQKEKQISELKSEFNEAEIKQFIKDCVDAKELLNRDIQNLRGENIQNLLTVVNVWVSAGFIPLDRMPEVEENLRRGNGVEYVKALLQAILADIERKRNEAEGELKELNENLLAAEKDVERLYALGNEYLQKISQLERTNGELIQEISQRDVESGHLAREVNASHLIIAQIEDKILSQAEEMRAMRETLEKNMQDCAGKIQEVQWDLDHCQDNLETADEMYDHQKEVYRQILKEHSDKVEEDKEVIARLQSQLALASRQIQEYKEVNKLLGSQIDERVQQVQSLIPEVSGLQKENSELKARLANLQVRNDTLEDQAYEYLQHSEILKPQISVLLKENSELKAQLSAIQEKNVELSRELQECSLRTIRLSSERDECLGKNRTFLQRLKDLKENSDRLSVQKQDCDEKKRVCDDRNLSLLKNNKELVEKDRESRSLIKNLQRHVEELQEDINISSSSKRKGRR